MKKLLFILLFFACKAQGQIAITEHLTFNNQTTNASAFGANDATFEGGKLYLFVSTQSGTTNNGTLTGTTLTWTSVLNVGDATRRVQVFRCVPGSTVTLEDATLGSFGGGSTGYSVVIYEITGALTTGTNGADAIVQAVSNTGTASADPSITMAAITNSRNAVMTFFTNSINPFSGTPESGWTEDHDVGYTTPDNGTYIMHRLTTTDNTPTVTASASDWAGIAIEIQSAARRRIIID